MRSHERHHIIYHRQLVCLLNGLFRLRTKKTQNPHFTGPREFNDDRWLIFTRGSNVESCSMSRHLHENLNQLVQNVRHRQRFYDSIMCPAIIESIFCVTGPLWGEFTGGLPSQRPVTQSFDVFFDLGLNKQLSKQSRRWWFETPSRSLWLHCNDNICFRQPYLNSQGEIWRIYCGYNTILHIINAILVLYWALLKRGSDCATEENKTSRSMIELKEVQHGVKSPFAWVKNRNNPITKEE